LISLEEMGQRKGVVEELKGGCQTQVDPLARPTLGEPAQGDPICNRDSKGWKSVKERKGSVLTTAQCFLLTNLRHQRTIEVIHRGPEKGQKDSLNMGEHGGNKPEVQG